jgi:hypothetical protein
VQQRIDFLMNDSEFDLSLSYPHTYTTTAPVPLLIPDISIRKPLLKLNGKRENCMVRESLFDIRRGDLHCIVSEDYSYKTETYYAILRHELEGNRVIPSSKDILDAYVVPICLERARLTGIPVPQWGISQGYFPVPAIIYGVNYFSTTSDYVIVSDSDKAKDVTNHITNHGKYPFCYQKIGDGATVQSCISVFGETVTTDIGISQLAKKVYDLFSLPLVKMVFLKYLDKYQLSSLNPTKYTQIPVEERALLMSHIINKEIK